MSPLPTSFRIVTSYLNLGFDNSLSNVFSFKKTKKSIKHVVKTLSHMLIILQLALHLHVREESGRKGERERGGEEEEEKEEEEEEEEEEERGGRRR